MLKNKLQNIICMKTSLVLFLLLSFSVNLSYASKVDNDVLQELKLSNQTEVTVTLEELNSFNKFGPEISTL